MYSTGTVFGVDLLAAIEEPVGALVDEGHQERAEEGVGAEGAGDEEREAERDVAWRRVAEQAARPGEHVLHREHVGRGGETRDAEKKAEREAELVPREPLDQVLVGGQCERVAADAEQEAARAQHPVLVEEGAGREHELSECEERREHDGAEPDAEHAVDEEAAEEAGEHVGPRAPAVERYVRSVVQTHLLHEHSLHGARVVEAEVVAEREGGDDDEDEEAVRDVVRITPSPQTGRPANKFHRVPLW